MSDLELATTQLESWVDNRTPVGLVFESGFAVGLTEHGTLERFEGLFLFRNAVLTVTFTPSSAPDVRWEDGVYQVRLKYDCGQLSFFEYKVTKGSALPAIEGEAE